MPENLHKTFLALCALFCAFSATSHARGLELFAKASASKNYIDHDSYTLSVSGSTGMAFTLIPQVRIEARYTLVSQQQNKLTVILADQSTATLNNVVSETNIFSLGLDIDILSDKHSFQPFVYLGGGYIETTRTYTWSESGTDYHFSDPKKSSFTVNVGLGVRVRIARSVAFEIEAFGYGENIHKPNPLVNLFGTAGIRLFL